MRFFPVRQLAISVTLFTFATAARSDAPTIPAGTPIDEAYRSEFAKCDDKHQRTFYGVHFPYYEAHPKSGKPRTWIGCDGDPSVFRRFEKVPAKGGAPLAVIIETKIAHDEDGSKIACSDHHPADDNCSTAFMLKPTARHPCPEKLKSQGRFCWPMDATSVPYVVIPAVAPSTVPPGIPPARPRDFRDKSGLQKGDYGVVFFGGYGPIPVIIGDVGAWNKIGEGSTNLLDSLHETAVTSGAVTILFPGSHDNDVAKLSPDTLPCDIDNKAMSYYRRLMGLPPKPPTTCTPK